MIMKNLDLLFQKIFTESKASQKHTSDFSNRAKFLLSFHNYRRYNKINQMAAVRMDLVFIDIDT